MGIKQKTALLIGSTAVLLVAITIILAGIFIISNSKKYDTDLALMRLAQANEIIATESANLRRITIDYASWDETYEFARDQNKNFIESNFSDETFAKNHFGFVMIFNNSGENIFKKAFDLSARKQIPFQELFEENTIYESNLLISQENSVKCGFLKTNNKLFLLASAPILTSQYGGPSRGVMIIGYEFNNDEIQKISNTIKIPLEIISNDISTTLPIISSKEHKKAPPLQLSLIHI